MPEVPFWEDPRLQEISEEARQWLDAPEGTSPSENVRRAAGLTRARATAPANAAELLASYARPGGAARPTGLVPASIQPQAPSSIPLEEFADYESMQESTQRGIQPGDVFDDVFAEMPSNVIPPSQFETLLNRTPTTPRKEQIGKSIVTLATNKVNNLNENLYNKALQLKADYQAGDLIPGFISKPLGLKNPLVQAGGVVQEGAALNPEAINWLRSQPENPLNRAFMSALGGEVTTHFKNEKVRTRAGHVEKPYLDISFRGTSGYEDPSTLKQAIARSKKDVASWNEKVASLKSNPTYSSNTYMQDMYQSKLKFNEEILNRQLSALGAMQDKERANPLAKEAIRYRLGDAISSAPENTVITARPIGGPAGGRAVMYRRMSGGALPTIPRLAIDLSRIPTNEEFRLAGEGGGMSLEEYRRALPRQGGVYTTKVGPEDFKTWRGDTVKWNPEELKDPLIRTAFGIKEGVDVSSLRKNPTGVFLNKRPVDFSLPVITTSSPQYMRRQAAINTGNTIKTGGKALLLDAGINYALGASPQEALASVSDVISAEGFGGAPTASIERMGPRGEFVDTRSNTVINPQGAYTKTGIAYKNGRPVIVPRGSVAGEGNFLTQTQSVLQNAANVWQKRLGAFGMFGR
jgi:hypothetical protein